MLEVAGLDAVETSGCCGLWRSGGQAERRVLSAPGKGRVPLTSRLSRNIWTEDFGSNHAKGAAVECLLLGAWGRVVWQGQLAVV